MAVFFNDRFIDNEQALVHVSDLSMQRGYAIFDFFRTMQGIPLFLHDHLSRFFASADAMRLSVPYTSGQLEGIVYELLQRSSLGEAGIRIMLTGGYSPDSYTPASPNLVITCNPVRTVTDADVEQGSAVITYPHQRELPQIKTINYTTAVWLQPMVKAAGAGDVLYYSDASITEFPRSNVFIVTQKGTLVTPAHHILHGITRKQVLHLAQQMAIAVEVRDIPHTALADAAEVLTTSTTKKVLPVTRINGQPVGNGGPGRITLQLYQAFLAHEQDYIQRVSR